MASVYPGTLPSYTNKTNKVDLVDAGHVNALQDDVVALAAELGVDPAGSCTDLKTRLYVSLDNDGAIRHGTSFPANPITGQPFWRTDESTKYIYTGSAWQALGNNLSNVLFSFGLGAESHVADTNGIMISDTLVDNTKITLGAWSVYQNTYRTVLTTKFKKIAGISSVTVWVNATVGNYAAHGAGSVKVDIGGQNNSVSIPSSTFGWYSFSVDVSSLTNGTTYNVTIQLKAGDTGDLCSLGEIIGIAS